MMNRFWNKVLVLLALLTLSGLQAHAQFKEEAFNQKFNEDQASADSTDKIFSIKEYWGGITHKQELDVVTLFEGSTVILGGMQIYNKDYWKLPIVYGGIAGGLAGGFYLKSQGSDAAKYAFLGAGLCYWGSLMDGVISYKPDDYPNPGKAMFYSMLVPGLGQIYNHEVWKLPIYWGIMIGGYNYYQLYRRNYERYRDLYNNEDTSIISLSVSKHYKDVFRRYRDYAVLVMAAGYVIQIIDANVFAFMHDFEVTEDLSLDIHPTIIAPDNAYAFSPVLGVGLGIRF